FNPHENTTPEPPSHTTFGTNRADWCNLAWRVEWSVPSPGSGPASSGNGDASSWIEACKATTDPGYAEATAGAAPPAATRTGASARPGAERHGARAGAPGPESARRPW